MDWYRWHLKIYKADTMHLDPYQDGCYRRLIDHIMETRLPLPDNDAALARIVGDSLENWIAKASAQVRPLFKVGRDGFLHQKRANMELNYQDSLTKRKSEAGKKGAKSRWENENENNNLDGSAIAAAPKSHSRGEERRGEESILSSSNTEHKKLNLVGGQATAKPTKSKNQNLKVFMEASFPEHPADLPTGWGTEAIRIAKEFSPGTNLDLKRLILFEWDRFYDFWQSGNKQKIDWLAAWRNWWRSEFKKYSQQEERDERIQKQFKR